MTVGELIAAACGAMGATLGAIILAWWSSLVEEAKWHSLWLDVDARMFRYREQLRDLRKSVGDMEQKSCP